MIKTKDQNKIINKKEINKMKKDEKPKIEKYRISVSKEAQYPGQDMRWTERVTGKEIADGKTLYYHYSDNRIREFRAKETAFFDSFNNRDTLKPTDKGIKQDSEYLYAYKPKKGKKGDRYDNEVRFNLIENDKLYLIGRIDRYWLGFKDPRRNAYKYVPYINENIILIK